MSQTDAYFQFPLALLQHAKSTQKIIQDASAMSMLTYGESMDEETRDNILQECYDDYDADDDDQMSVAAGAVRLGVSVGNVEAVALKARRLRDKYGTGGMQVRVRSDIAWSAHDDDWPLPKLRVLCAIYAGIGERNMRRMTRLLLRAHAAGFSSPKGIKPSQMLTEKQVRYWADKLWMQNLFQMAADGHDLWYSNRCKNDTDLARGLKLQAAVTKRKTVIQVGDI